MNAATNFASTPTTNVWSEEWVRALYRDAAAAQRYVRDQQATKAPADLLEYALKWQRTCRKPEGRFGLDGQAPASVCHVYDALVEQLRVALTLPMRAALSVHRRGGDHEAMRRAAMGVEDRLGLGTGLTHSNFWRVGALLGHWQLTAGRRGF